MPKSHIAQVLEIRQSILKNWPQNRPRPQFVAVADFDGTLMFGDCSEGYPGMFDGLAKKAVLSGLTDYSANEAGCSQLYKDYESLSREMEEKAILFFAKIFSPHDPVRRERLLKLARETFDKEYRQYIFPKSRFYVEDLLAQGIRTLVISASPQTFVAGAHAVLPIQESDIYGIHVEPNGQPSDGILNYRIGKLHRLQKIIDDHTAAGIPIIPILGLGNDWASDYPFLQAIATNHFPFTGLALMINGLRHEHKPLDSIVLEVIHALDPFP